MALTVSRDSTFRIVDMCIETNGAYWDLFKVDYRQSDAKGWEEVCRDRPTYTFSLAIESRNRFRRLNIDLLRRNGLDLSDIDHFVMQNISIGAFEFYEQCLEIHFARSCRTNLRRFGHLGSMDIIINLHTGLLSGEFSSGDRVLVMNNSPVAAWSSMLILVV